MLKYLITAILIFECISINAQSLTGPETVSKYSIAQKRLLVISTAEFLNFISSNNLDQDSVMLIASRLTGMPFLIPYNEGFQDRISPGTDLINAGMISEAKQMLDVSNGENKIQLLLELGTWYLHRPGTHSKDLDTAKFYTETASKLVTEGKYLKWGDVCLFLLAELYYQERNISGSKNSLVQIISSGQHQENIEMVARCYQQLGKQLPDSDSMKLVYYKKSFDLYKKLNLKEKEIELLGDISAYHRQVNMYLMEQDLRQILLLQHLSGFKHTLYAQNIFSYVRLNQAMFLDALEYADSALENVKWSGITALNGPFFIRTGAANIGLGKNEEALTWFRKTLETGRKDNYLFWYKSLIFAAELLYRTNRTEESLAMINRVTLQFPPSTVWEKIQILSLKGMCYKNLNKYQLADKYFMELIRLTNENPGADPHEQLSTTYMEIADFYATAGNIKNAYLFLKKETLSSRNGHIFDQAQKYSLLSKLDSIAGNYKSALLNHIQYKIYYDSSIAIDQRKKLEELTAEKKDKDLLLLKQQGIAKEAQLTKSKLTRNIMIAGSLILLVFIGLLYNRFRLKQRTNKQLEYQQKEITKKNIILQHLVEEKEWLLKEVHHRVKNNLQTVVSLLELQSENLHDEALSAIQDSQNRIYAMSLIHQKLYQTENIASINMQPYLLELINQLQAIYNPVHKIKFDLQVEAVGLDVSQAIPVGLIVNEAVTNAIKYAFNYGISYPEISIILQQSKKNILKLTVTDNGIGIPSNFDIDKTTGLGFKLMKGLVEDIEGTFTVEKNQGTVITVVFNASVTFDEKAEKLEQQKEIAG
jgi:two-component sensor histidine kinase